MSMNLTFKDVRIDTPTGRRLLAVDAATLAPGLFALTGQNGAGKSTLLRTIMGLHPLSGGSIAIDNTDSRRDRRKFLRLTAFQPQNFAAFPEHTAARFLTYFGRLRGLTKREAASTGREWLARVGLDGAADHLTGTFSPGMLQRLGLAYVLQTGSAGLYVLDEPFAGVDPEARAALTALLAQESKNRIVLMSTHHVDEVVAHGAALLEIAAGRLNT